MRMLQRALCALGTRHICPTAPHSPALRTCPPPISPGIARIPRTPPSSASPAVRATEARLSPSHPPSPRAFLARSPAPAAHAVVWRSRALSGGPVPLLWLHDQLLLVTVLVQRCANHFSTLACHHMIMLSLSPTPPLNHCLRPDFPLTFDPPDRILWLCGRMETWLDPFLAFSWSLTRWIHPSAAQQALSRIDLACRVCDACGRPA